MLKYREDRANVESANKIMECGWDWITDGSCKDVLSAGFDGIDKVEQILMEWTDDIYDTVVDDEGNRYNIGHLMSTFSLDQIEPFKMQGMVAGEDYRVVKCYA